MSAELVVGLALGVPTLLATIYFGVKQLRANRSRIVASAFLAELCDSIRVAVTNEGSAEGAVHGLEIVDAEGRRIDLPGAGKSFEEFKLGAQSSREIDFNAPENRDFRTTDKVVVRWGRHEERLELLSSAGSYWDEKSPSEPASPPEQS